MFARLHHRPGRAARPAIAAGAAGIAAALLASITPAPAFAVPTASVGTVRWHGDTVGLVAVDASGVTDAALTFVGKAVGLVTADPRFACLNGGDLAVYSTSVSESLVFTTLGDPTACVLATFEPVVTVPEGTIPEQDAACLTRDCITDMSAFYAGQARQTAFYTAGAAEQRVQSLPAQADGDAKAALAVSIVEQLAGSLIAQVDTLTDLYSMEGSVSLTNFDARMRLTVAGQQVNVASPLRINASNALGCLLDGCPLVTYSIAEDEDGDGSILDAVNKSGQDPSVDPAKFVYYTGLTPTWENKDRKRGVYGAVIYNVWRVNKRVSNAWDFWGTTQTASVSPEHKSRLTKLETMLTADGQGSRIVEASPMSVQQKGEGETVVLNATLQGNVSAKRDGTGGEIGGTFGVSRSYTKPVHNHGGGMDGPLGHFAHWSTGDNGSGYTKEAAGVETWSLPAGNAAHWGWWARAWYCNDPCGP